MINAKRNTPKVEQPLTFDEALIQLKETNLKLKNLEEDNEKLKIQSLATEQIAAETSLTQQQLLELLIEMEVI